METQDGSGEESREKRGKRVFEKDEVISLVEKVDQK